MFNPALSIEERAGHYASKYGRPLATSLGFGKDGNVFFTEQNTAIKVFARAEVFTREHECYLRLMELKVTDVLGFHVPQLLHADADLLVLEMTTVQPPFLLDFGSAYLDWAPDFSPEVLDEWRQRKAEEFGTRWPKVEVLLEFMADTYGIYLTDVHPGNITFA